MILLLISIMNCKCRYPTNLYPVCYTCYNAGLSKEIAMGRYGLRVNELPRPMHSRWSTRYNIDDLQKAHEQKIKNIDSLSTREKNRFQKICEKKRRYELLKNFYEENGFDDSITKEIESYLETENKWLDGQLKDFDSVKEEFLKEKEKVLENREHQNNLLQAKSQFKEYQSFLNNLFVEIIDVHNIRGSSKEIYSKAKHIFNDFEKQIEEMSVSQDIREKELDKNILTDRHKNNFLYLCYLYGGEKMLSIITKNKYISAEQVVEYLNRSG